MKDKIAYKKISNWCLATDFYHTWREVFLYIKEHQNEFYIWNRYHDKNLEIKLVSINNFLTLKFTPNGFLSKEFDDNINTIKFRRSKHFKKYNNEPTITITHTYRNPNRYQYYHTRPYLTSMDEILIPNYHYNADIDMFVSTIEQLFDKINLTDKKRIYHGTERWKKRKDKWSAISFWKCINKMFTINFDMGYKFDEKLKFTDKAKYQKYKIFIDVKERYNMELKSDEYAMKKRQEEIEKRKSEMEKKKLAQ